MMQKRITALILTGILLFGGFAWGVFAAPKFEDIPVFVDPRYLPQYPPRFFETGGPRVKYSPEYHLKIGIVIRNQTEMTIPYIISVIFASAPLDRYRDFFVFANSNEVLREVRQNNQFITTYDANGRRIGGGFDWAAMRVRAGLVVLDVNDYEFRRSGTLGYAFSSTAVTQKTTILHELGHVLGDLGDEYSIGEQENEEEMTGILSELGEEYVLRMGKSWNRVRANLEYRTRNPMKWFPLIEQGFLPETAPPRVEIKEEIDVGQFSIPSEKCVMNHPEKSDGRFCAVCQLQLIDKICQYTGADWPWDEYF